MDRDFSRGSSRVPSFARPELYDFDATEKSFELYKELNAISEEIEKCRLENC